MIIFRWLSCLILTCILACADESDTQMPIADGGFDAEQDQSLVDAQLADSLVIADASLADASEPDSNPPLDMGRPAADCESWAALQNGGLQNALHEHLFSTYQPIQPTPNFGGMPDRYTTARQLMFTQVYRFLNEDTGGYVVQCVYTNDQAFTPPDRDPDDDLINCEHLWPRSRLNPDRGSRLYEHQQSDIHHLAPTRPTANSLRGSLKFGEVVRDRNLDASPSIAGKNTRGDQVFEPQDSTKGDIARALFYMSIRWGLPISADEEDVLRRWHREDAVQAEEYAKNDVIETLQGNRNPFVDCPNLVDRIVDFDAFEILDTPATLPFP